MRNIDEYTREYEMLGFENRKVGFRRRVVIENIKKYPHDNILEIGCGLEPLFEYFDNYKKMTIVEPSSVFFKNARNQAQHDARIECIHAFVEEVVGQLQEDAFDMIIVSGLLHEVENPRIFLREIKRMCGLHTIVHINVPNAHSIHRLLGMEMSLIGNEFALSDANVKMQQHSVFSLNTLKMLVEEEGFHIIEEGSFFIKPFSSSQMEAGIQQGIFDESLLEGLYKLERHLPGFGSEIYINIFLK